MSSPERLRDIYPMWRYDLTRRANGEPVAVTKIGRVNVVPEEPLGEEEQKRHVADGT